MAGYKRTKKRVSEIQSENRRLEELLDEVVERGDIPEGKRIRGLIVENERLIEELWEDCTW